MANWRSHIYRFSAFPLIVSISMVAYAQENLPPIEPLPMPEQMQETPTNEGNSTINNLAENVGQLLRNDQEDAPASDAAAVETAVAALNQPISLGEFGMSMMYNEEDINNVSRVLSVYEATIVPDVGVAETSDGSEQDILSELLRSMQGEGEVLDDEIDVEPLPTFYVGTIMYRRAGDWAVWINGARYDNTRSPESGDEIQIAGIGRERVTLSWKPERMSTAYDKWKNRANPNLGKVNHRHAYHSFVDFDTEKRRFTISMRSNQTFVGDDMDVIEGRLVQGVRVQQAAVGQGAGTQESSDGGAAVTTLQNTSSSQSIERQISDDLISNIEQLQQFIPVPQTQQNQTP